jgi:hypothetical protein
MSGRDGRHAVQPYRARVGAVWYWIDPTAPTSAIEPGDMVIIYPASGDASLATFQSRSAESIEFATLDGERFAVPTGDIAALHLAAVDEDQS